MLSFRESYIYPPPRRFGCKGKNQVKLRTNVLFNMKLNVSPFLSSPEQNSLYSLYAVVVSKDKCNPRSDISLRFNVII